MIEDLDELDAIASSTQFTTGRNDARGKKHGKLGLALSLPKKYIGRRPRKNVKITLSNLKFMDDKNGQP